MCAGPEALAAREQPGVLFIVVDTLRSDHLGCYGYDKIKTPHIDALARSGALFQNVISQAPLTFPSHCSFFTSTYPQFNKVRDNGSFKLDPSAVTLAEVMRDNGFATAAFVSTFVLDKKFGLDQGFQTYDDTVEKFRGTRVIKFMDEERKADKVTDAAIAWLRENRDKKFFLWAHYYDPHTVYNPPDPYKETYKDNLYDGEIAYADEQIGRLLAFLKELGLDRKTLIVLCSDHGESLGEHGENGHAVFIYDATIKVPLIFSYPGVIPEGKVIGGQVRLIDLMPTILDLLGIRKHKEIQGESLSRLMLENAQPLELSAYSESYYGKLNFNWEELVSLRAGRWKYIRSREPELYNITTDPGEFNNLASSRKDLVDTMDRELEEFLKKTASEDKEEKPPIDEETRQKLMSLGYIQGQAAAVSPAPVSKEKVRIMQKLNLADRMANQDMIDKAIVMYNEILSVDPDNFEAILHLGHCYRTQGKYDEAIRWYRKSASFKPENPESHNGLGNIYKTMGKAEEAFKEFSVAHALDPEDPAIINNIGWYYQQKAQFGQAMEQYRKVLAIDDQIATTHANMGIIYRVGGQLDKAMEELNIAIKLDPQLAFAYSELCACVAIKGDLDGAIAYCDKAIELDPEGLDGYNNRGVCYERKGDFDKALESYFKAQKVAPWSPLVYINIGNVYTQQRQLEKAAQYYRKALEIDPQNQNAAEKLRILSAGSPVSR